MNNPITVLLMFGGKSDEHPISIRSAKAILSHLSPKKYQVNLLYIHRNGDWSLLPDSAIDESRLTQQKALAPLPWNRHKTKPPFPFQGITPDIVFPVLHGPNGEDGRLQGFLQMQGIPFVGSSAVGSLLSMDKGLSKTLCEQAGLPIVPYRVFSKGEQAIAPLVLQKFSFPVFVKPCNLGSSVGISRVDAPSDLDAAITLAFDHDHRIIVEQGIPVREIEISVLGRFPEIRVSQPGELVPHNRFYDYNDKYLDGKTSFSLPADLNPSQVEEARDLARRAYTLHQIDGYARVDLFLHKESGRFYLNEINTIPGFTEISMFPKLWQLEGLTFPALLDILIELGFGSSGS